MAFNIDRGSKEPEKQKEFLEKLVIILPDRYQNKCEKKKTSDDYDEEKTMPEETEEAKTMPEESDERINFFLDIVKYFRCECLFAKQIDSKLESVKRFFANLKVCYYNRKLSKTEIFILLMG
ncbi:unnamed protein product [Meloidogyne enterolobii]|uniref:Uncharacterized protein n=1 Tax=Meloidogyne enterolobii TaxID=390850 RepID=A0ACB1B7A6_MELEN